MKKLSLIILVLFCQLLNTSVAFKRKDSEEFEILSTVLEKYSLENLSVLELYFNEKIYIKKHTSADFDDVKSFNEVLLKKVFPGYSRNNKRSNISEIYCRDKLNEEGSSAKNNLTSYFNGFLIKVDDEWKVRKVEENEIVYQEVDGHNVMDLVEFLYAFRSNGREDRSNFKSVDIHTERYETSKLLALIKAKYQLKEVAEEEGRAMLDFEKQFWDKYDLGSDLVQKVTERKYVFDKFQHDGRDELFFGVDGEKPVVHEHLGNTSFAGVFGRHLGDFLGVGLYYNMMRDQFNAKDMIKVFIESLKERGSYTNAVKDQVEGNEETATEKTTETEESDAKSADDVSLTDHTTESPKPHQTGRDRKIKLKMSNKQIERTEILPIKFSNKELPCKAHLKRAMKVNKESYKFWKPFCNSDGSYRTNKKICKKRSCWCVDNKGMFLKQIFETSEKC